MRDEKSLEFAESELLNERKNWLHSLKIERGLSKLTLEAYERDTRQFLAFLMYHFGNKIGLGSLHQLAPSDLRAFIFERRRYGIDNHSLKRSLSGIRSFLRYLKKHGLVNAADVLGMKTLKKSKHLPRPLSETQALNLVCYNLDFHLHSWVNARDLSILHLLYGCGLRISEA
ncbi:site-specific integrase, partial [Candidatus Liberibacter sp.]|uniref:site-specific integrase n=1 Tax=Candidatus Liberibacter sp. TaxID=34022 RepID=UPI0015F60BA1